MGGNSRRVIGVSLLCFLAAVLVFLVYSIVTFQPKLVLSVFMWRWVWNQSLVFFIETLVPLQATALLLYYSLLNPMERLKRSSDAYEPFYRLVNGVLVTLLVFTLLFTALAEGVRPWLYGRQNNMLDQTKLARLFYFNYESAKHESKFEDAEYYLQLYLKINPRDQQAQRQLDEAKLDAAKALSKASETGSPAPPQKTEYLNQSAQGLVKIAQSYLLNTDYSSARYYATLALDVAPRNAEAGRISRESLRALSRITTSPAEREQKDYFQLKSQGRSDLESGHALRAFYLFQNLNKSHPKDPDVVTYLKRATDQLTQFAFFKDEIDKAAPYPGTRNILFVNQRGPNGTVFVLFRKIVTLTTGTYVEGVEAAAFSPTGLLVYHLTAPYAKLLPGKLSMYCVERDKAVSYLPTVLSGDFPDSEHWELPVSAKAGVLEDIGSFSDTPTQDGMPRLWSLTGSLSEYGYLTAPLRVEFLRRVMIPFAFLIFSIFAIGIGWSMRAGRRRPSFILFILLPLVPYVIYLFETFYLFSGKVVFAFIMTVAGFWPALISLLVVQFALVILSLSYLAGRSTEQ